MKPLYVSSLTRCASNCNDSCPAATVSIANALAEFLAPVYVIYDVFVEMHVRWMSFDLGLATQTG